MKIAREILISTALLVGCAGPQIQLESVTAFGTGVAKIRETASVAFRDANALARDHAKAAILANPQDGLTEDRFVVVINPTAMMEWDNAFAGMQTYVAGLQALMSKERSEHFGDATLNLGKELSEGHAKMPLPPDVGTAFTEIGKVLIEAQQKRDAMAAMHKADPAIVMALRSMAKAIGNDPRGPSAAGSTVVAGTRLMGTANSIWITQMANVATRFITAREGHDSEGMKAAINNYLDLMDRRDAALDSLASLRESLFSLAVAHTAASQGSNAEVAGLMGILSKKLDDIQATYKKFSELNEGKK
jgi:hypothetical protein